MALKNEGITMELDASISSLEDARDNAIQLLGSQDVGLQGNDLDADEAHDLEGAESELLVAEQHIEEMAQAVSEEIDNLRSLLIKIEEKIT